MAEKRYYWLKLKEDYFKSPKIKKLRKIAGGDTYTIIYLKMQLESIKNNGIINYEGIELTFEEELALKIDEELEDVKMTLAYLKAQSLIEENNNDYLFIEASSNIGSESQSAERVRLFREREREKEKMLQCNESVTPVLQNSISNSDSINYNNIITYLNEKAKTNYRSTTPKTQQFIKARMNEGFKEDDFYRVIDNKVTEWKGTEFEKFLRPETLFGTKFEGYLNSKNVRSGKQAEKHSYSTEELNCLFDNINEIEI